MTCKDCIYDKMCYVTHPKDGKCCCEAEFYWHTGEPTEEGWYVAILNDGHYGIIQYVVLKNWCKNDNTVAWHKIPDYEEQK